ncbi:MAG: amino acid adenylation domain-containing protein [Acidobacteriota bacterium]
MTPLLSSPPATALPESAATRPPSPAEASSLGALFQARAEASPHSTALVLPTGERWSYRRLARTAAAVEAALLRRLPRPRGQAVGLCLELGGELLAAMLGVLQSGAFYVPLDPSHPPARLGAVAADAGVALVLTERRLAGAMGRAQSNAGGSSAPDFLFVEDLAAASSETAVPVVSAGPAVSTETLSAVGRQDLAYVIHTSGSSGPPKGVEVEHHQVLRLLSATESFFGFGEDDVWTLFHSFAFDFSVWEIWGALAYGGRLVLVPRSTARSSRAFAALLARERVTVLNQTPSAFRGLLGALGSSEGLPEAARPRDLRWVIFGGEALDFPSLAPWFQRYPEDAPRLVNMYGITETTVHVTLRPVAAQEVRAGSDSALGEAISDLQVHLLDPAAGAVGAAVESGKVGEIYVGGDGVTRGYRGRPGLTAARFLPDPFSSRPGARLYRSGDLALRGAGDEPYYRGRGDAQVKIRGHRVEPGEVAVALESHPLVQRAAVVPRALEGGGEEQLVAFVVGADVVSAEQAAESSPSSASLKAYLAARLPEAWVPSMVVPLDALPLTTNGKLDQRRLVDWNLRSARPPRRAPESAAERAAAAAWREVLGVREPGLDDDFFALGGHSLNAARILARLRREGGWGASPELIFEAPRLEDFAARLRPPAAPAATAATSTDAAASDAGVSPPQAPIRDAESGDAESENAESENAESENGSAPLAHAQLRMWLQQQLDPDSSAFHLAFGLRFLGTFRPAAMAAALTQIMHRQRALRTAYGERGGEVRGVLREPPAERLPTVDLRALEEPAVVVEELFAHEARRPFDLGAGRLLRARLLRLEDQHHVLLLTIHHIACDGWSLGILASELAALYPQGALSAAEISADAGLGPLLSPLEGHYADYARRQHRRLRGSELEALLAPRLRRLESWPPQAAASFLAPSPGLSPAPGRRGAAILVQRALPRARRRALERLARSQGASLFMVMVAALMAVIHRWTGASRIAVGALSAGRGEGDWERLVGCFINTLVIDSEVASAQPWEGLLKTVRGSALEAFGAEELPFDLLARRLKSLSEPLDSSESSAGELFQVMVAHQNLPLPSLAVPGLEWSLLEAPRSRRAAAFDLSLFLRPEDGELRLTLEADGGRFRREHAAALLADLDAVLAEVEIAPRRAVEQIPLPFGSLAALSSTLSSTVATLSEAALEADGGEASGLAGKSSPERGADSSTSSEGEAPSSPRASVEERIHRRQEAVGERRSRLSAKQRALLARRLAAKAKGRGQGPKKVPSEPPGSAGSDSSASPGSLESLSKSVDSSRSAAARIAGIPRRRGLPAPLSFGQERLWFLQRLEPESSAYNLVDAFLVSGRLEPRRFAAALGAVVERHEILRSAYEPYPESGIEGWQGEALRVVQVPGSDSFGGLRTVDLSGLPEAQAQRQVQRLLRAEGARPFRLEAGEVLRVHRLVLGPERAVLLFDLHHVAADAWSFYVMVRELGELYSGTEPAPLPVQYGDYALWQRRRLSGERLEGEIQWWRQRLEGAPQLLPMTLDRPRPAVRSAAGRTCLRQLPARLGEALDAYASAREMTPFMVSLALFQVLVSRHGGGVDFLLGSPSTHRERRELEGLVGFFVNTLILRADLGGEPSLHQLASRVKAAALDTFAHQDLPFERLVEALSPQRSLSHLPLVQGVFVYESTPRTRLESPGLTFEALPFTAETAKFDLTLALRRTPEGPVASLEYSTDLIEAATAEALLARYEALLTAALDSPQLPVQQLPMLSPGEREQLLARDPGRDAAAPGAVLPLRFEAIARAQPEAVALRMPAAGLAGEAESWTYADLALRASAVARWLAEVGVGPESRVGLCLPRGPELVAALVGILGAGGAYVPLDPAYPQQRLRYLVEDSAIQVVVSTASLVRQLDLPPSLQVVEVPPLVVGQTDSTLLAELLPPEPLFPAALSLTPDHLAYVIYTSGSTGRPKGVLIPHGQVGRLLEVSQPLFCFGPGDVWTLFHSFAFDFSVWEIWGALGFGGRLLVVPESTTRDPAAFYRLLALEGVTVLNQTPSAFVGLIRADSAVEVAERESLNLRWVIFGGEALEAQTLGPWVEHHGLESPALVNMYGITETTVHVTFSRVTSQEIRGEESTSLGSALGDLSLRVVEAPVDGGGSASASLACDLAPEGVVGELWVGGAGLARGYHGRPALTAQRFVPDPFGKASGARAYRSGDGARWVRRPGEAGAPFSLAYEGRLDHQLKVRGYRIEAGEVESALASDGEVSAAVVTSRRVNREGVVDVRLAAYLVSKESSETLVPRLRSALAERLPAPLVPQDWVVLESLPLTAHGKVDRSRLPAPAAAAAGPSSSFVAPSGDVEQRVASIFSQVLGVESVGSEDSFFDLGGHSLLLVELQVQLEAVFGHKVEMLDLFRYPTVNHLARFMEDAGAPAAPATEEIPSAAHRGAESAPAEERAAPTASADGAVQQRYDRARLRRRRTAARGGRRRGGAHRGVTPRDPEAPEPSLPPEENP